MTTDKDKLRNSVEALRTEYALKLALAALGWYDRDTHQRAITAIRAALASKSEALASEASEQPTISAGPITPAMEQGPTPEQKAKIVEAMQPAQQQQDHDCALKRGGIICRHCDLEIVQAEAAHGIKENT